MNPEPECNYCGPSNAEPSGLPQCSTAPYIRRVRAEEALKPELLCSIKNCNIFGGHDTNAKPEFECEKKVNKYKDENKNSLGSPIGLVASNVNFKTEGKTSDIIQARYATYLKAFARLHLNEETFWDPLIIDDIMKEGLSLYTESQQKEEENGIESPSHIYSTNEANILREFELSNFRFHIELMPEFQLNSRNLSEEIGANGDAPALILEDFKRAMKSFFRQHKYALITVASTFYALIWRSKEAYFIFDACGRRVNDFHTDKDKGVAMLICLSSLENIRHLLMNLSDLQATDPLNIRQIKVVKVITPAGGIIQQDYAMRSHQFQVVNDDYAYLRSTLHLTLNKNDLLRNRSALPVAIAALVATKIDHPATWDMKMLDKIICFGVGLCQTFWAKCRSTEIVDITEFPTYFTMGQFQITIKIMPNIKEGIWRCLPDFKNSDLYHNLKKAFDNKLYKLLLQINYQIYAIWQKNDFIYLLDPYRHRILGKAFDSEIYEQMEKSSTVRMFRSFEVFMNVFNHILLDSNRTSKFFVHALKIKNIQKKLPPKEHNLRTIEDLQLDEYGEIRSLNEHICFEEAEDLCQKALAEISDYEDDDLRSDVVEIELRTSSSEAEDLLEEEEAVAGEAEEIEGLETSSSGEEGGHHKKKALSGAGKRKGSKGGKSKGGKGKKSAGGKGKKGQGASDSMGGGKKRKKVTEGEETEESSEDESKSDKKRKKKAKGLKEDDERDKNYNKQKKDKKYKPDNKEDKNLKDNESKDKDLKEKEAKDKNLKENEAKDKDLNEKFGGLKGKEDKDLKEKEQQNTDVKVKEEKDKHKDLKDKDLKDKDLKDKDPKDKDLKDTNLKDKDLKDKNLKDKDLKDKEQKNKDLNDKEQKELQSKGKEEKAKDLKEKDLQENQSKVKDPKDLKEKDKELKESYLKDKELKDKAVKDKELKDKDLKEKQLNDKDLKDKELKDKDSKLKSGDNKDIKTIKESEQKKTDKPEDLDKYKQDKDKTAIKLEENRENTHLEDKDKRKSSKDANKDITDDLRKSLLTALTQGDKTKLPTDKEGDQTTNSDKENKDQVQRKEKLQKDQQDFKLKPRKSKTLKHYQSHDDGTEADDENEECFKQKRHYCSLPNPNRYPGYLKCPVDLAVLGSEDGSYKSICKLFQAGFKVADRLLIMTPWGNFVIFRCGGKLYQEGKQYYLFDGCTCNFERFRHLDLSVGTAGLLCFKHIHNVIEYIRHLRKTRREERRERSTYTAEEICREYCSRSTSSLRV